MIWGGVEHVTFLHAPTVYAAYTSAAIRSLGPPAVRGALHLGYDTLGSEVEVEPAHVPREQLFDDFVRLKETEGLYRMAVGAVHLEDAVDGRRAFHVDVPLPAGTPPGDIQVAIFELAPSGVIADQRVMVALERVGMPAVLHGFAHSHGVLYGLLALAVSLTTGLTTGLLGSRGSRRRNASGDSERGPFGGVLREVRDALFAPQIGSWPMTDPEALRQRYVTFRNLLSVNTELLELLAELEEESSWTSFRHPRVRMGIRAMFDGTADMVRLLNELSGNRYFDLATVIASIRRDVTDFIAKASEREDPRLALQMAEIGSATADQAGGKAVNLARLECDQHLNVPLSFVVTAEAYREFLEHEDLASKLRTVLAPVRLDWPEDFERRCSLAQEMVQAASVPPAVTEAIRSAFRASGLGPDDRMAVRSSALGEESASRSPGSSTRCSA